VIDYWMENAFEAGKHTLVDVGYVNAKAARDQADRLLKRVGKKNLQIVANGRILIRIPPQKVKAILKRFRSIKPASERPGYSWCTHTAIPAGAGDVKHAS